MKHYKVGLFAWQYNEVSRITHCAPRGGGDKWPGVVVTRTANEFPLCEAVGSSANDRLRLRLRYHVDALTEGEVLRG